MLQTFFLRLIFLFLFSLFSIGQAKNSKIDKVTYMGVHATKLSPEMRHQLDFSPGLFLSVIRIGENSPAEKAGLQIYDVLLSLDEQILINQEQLKQLVRMKLPGDSIEVKLVRKGSERKIQVVLEETEKRVEKSFGNRMDSFGDDFFSGNDLFDNGGFRNFFGREFGLNSLRRQMQNNRDFPNQFNIIDNLQTDDPVHQPGADIQSFSYSSTQNQRVVTDEEGTLEWTEKDGNKYLRVTSSSGELIFEGPINTKEERNLLPLGVSERLKKIESNRL